MQIANAEESRGPDQEGWMTRQTPTQKKPRGKRRKAGCEEEEDRRTFPVLTGMYEPFFGAPILGPSANRKGFI